MAEPSIGDSKRKGIVSIAITGLVALQTTAKTEYIVGGIVLLALAFIVSETIFKSIDNKKS